MRLYDVIAESAGAARKFQRDDGSFPGGDNGPYGDPETPVRNTAHWLITLLKAFQITGDERFEQAARAAGRYLASDAARPMGATFFCRANPEKDFCNGLVGQAWVIEALVAGGEGLGEVAWIDLARELFLLHPFDPEFGLWRIVNVDGSYRGYDVTFNHQLWFAACGSLIPASGDIAVTAQVTRFLDRAATVHLRRVSRRGRVMHHIRGFAPSHELLKRISSWRRPLAARRSREAMEIKEIGYHAFNLYGLALLRRAIPEHVLWRSDSLGRSLRYLETNEFLDGLETSQFAYGYNPTGFEVAFALEVLEAEREGSAELRRWWIERQLVRTMGTDSLLTGGTTDPITLAARLYQATRLTDLSLSWDPKSAS
jgi:hypothetical protein